MDAFSSFTAKCKPAVPNCCATCVFALRDQGFRLFIPESRQLDARSAQRPTSRGSSNLNLLKQDGFSHRRMLEYDASARGLQKPFRASTTILKPEHI